MSDSYGPLKLRGERVWRTYTGGREIGRIHGEQGAKDGHFPEEWMFSTTRALNAGREEIEEGICRLDEDREISLKQLILSNPEDMLGKGHVGRWGASTGVLIKMIDSEERLTIQVHPDREMAGRLFNSRFGKTECWYILGTRSDGQEPACIYLGFKEGITREEWVRCFERQDYVKMLSLLNRIQVTPGETYLVKGGVPHAIGSGCMIIEIQEPTDYTIRVEKVTPSGFRIDDRMCHQGLGCEKMFDCFSYCGMSEDEIRGHYGIRAEDVEWSQGIKSRIIGYKDTPCFQIERMDVKGACSFQGDGVYGCLYVLSGKGILKSSAHEYTVGINDQFFIPAVSGEYTITSTGNEPVSLLMMRGPQ